MRAVLAALRRSERILLGGLDCLVAAARRSG